MVLLATICKHRLVLCSFLNRCSSIKVMTLKSGGGGEKNILRPKMHFFSLNKEVVS